MFTKTEASHTRRNFKKVYSRNIYEFIAKRGCEYIDIFVKDISRKRLRGSFCSLIALFVDCVGRLRGSFCLFFICIRRFNACESVYRPSGFPTNTEVQEFVVYWLCIGGPK